ncbi:MAG: acetyl-CoA carboxylase biotin carboxyl carrier protein [Acidobacteria bacterium]|nr:acetyl-CoA carboxylase biotin carboxyl carrier protein [Acidobacteriota bacterium]
MALLSYQEILQLIDKISEKGMTLVEIETGGVRIRIERSSPEPRGEATIAPMAATATSPAMAAPMPSSGTGETDQSAQEAGDDESWHVITSPIVGTFYRSANPESEPLVKQGDRVTRGAVLCIIEAMKLFNEIESDSDGVIEKIYPENGQPIEYGEKLFALRR